MDAAGQRFPARPLLDGEWRLCPAGPGSPRPLDGASWESISGPLTVAAALRDRGAWSLDGPARDFDAQDWWYSVRFDAPGDSTRLRFDGLATLSQGWLNGQPVLEHTNMHGACEADVAAALRPQDNELVLRFASVQAALGQRRPRPRWRTTMVAHQQLRWHRTTLLGRTPGWSPPAAPVGPWRDICWVDYDDLLAWRLHAALDGGTGRVVLQLQPSARWTASLEFAELVLRGNGEEHRQSVGASGGTLSLPKPALWWPHTHGDPVLYEASLRWRSRDGGRGEQRLGSVGFRTVRIDQAAGRFRVHVNGAPVFCRGAGWTPLDPVSLRSTPQAAWQAVAQVRDAGLNMLRVAGTMVYEEDHFYDACDQFGLLVWQDFMYASMDYPFDDPAFAAGALEEARQQLQRLHHHPCLAVLCGNSEVEQQAAMWGAPRELWRPAFFHQTLPALCGEIAPGVPYWPSSAHGGAFPHQASSGTTSYYGVGAYERPLDDARRSNLAFATECLAFANVPALSTLERMPGGLATRVHHPAWKSRSPRDLGAGWDFDDVRDHYVQHLLGVDPARLRHSDHDRYLALGRLATAEAMRAAFAEWRRPASACGGALLLFLRDLWPGAGWGVLDDAGVPKAAWHALRSALQPLAVCMTDEGGNGIDVHVSNDTGHERQLALEVTAWRDGEVQVAKGALEVALPAHSASTHSCNEVLGQFLDLNHAYRFGPPTCDVVVAKLLDGEQRAVAQALHFPLGLAALVQPHRGAGLQARAIQEAGATSIEIEAARVAIGVHFDLPGWQADDEHFHLAPGERRRVQLHRVKPNAAGHGSVLALNAAAIPLEIRA